MKIVSKASLMERVTIGPRGCWVWNGALSKEGYAVLRCGDGQRPAQRVFWESFVGMIPPNHRILSRKVPGCVGKACCNPAHHRLQGLVVENRNGREFKRCRTCRREAWKSWQRQKTAENKRTKSQPGKRSK